MVIVRITEKIQKASTLSRFFRKLIIIYQIIFFLFFRKPVLKFELFFCVRILIYEFMGSVMLKSL